MPSNMPILKGSFPNGENERDSGKRPVVFDILGPDQQTSILPEGYRLVLQVNPTTMHINYNRKVERIQTKGGFVEQHWGDEAESISFEMATGGFMRLFTGLSAITSPAVTGGTRRETLAYDSYLDMLALFHNNGSVYDASNQVALQGIVKVTFDEGVYLGWFNNFSVVESTDKPFQFALTASMDISQEIQVWRTAITIGTSTGRTVSSFTGSESSSLTASAAAAASNSPG